MALALLLAGTLRAEAVLAVANLVWVLLLGLGIARADRPAAREPSRTVAALLPSGALGDALRTALVDGGWPWAPWAVLVAWGAVGGRSSPRGSSAGAADRPHEPCDPRRSLVPVTSTSTNAPAAPAARATRVALAGPDPPRQPRRRGRHRRHRRPRAGHRQRSRLPHLARVRRRLDHADGRAGRGLPQVHRVRQPHPDRRARHPRAGDRPRRLAPGRRAGR